MRNSMRMFGVSLCALLILLLRAGSLSLAERSPVYRSALTCQEYLLQSCLMILSGLLTVYAYRKYRSSEKDLFFILSILTAGLLAWGCMALQYDDWKRIFQQLLLGILPLMLLSLARFLRRKLKLTYAVPLYYTAVALFCWLLLDVLEPRSLLRWDIITLLYILILAFVIWNSWHRSLYATLKNHGFQWLRREERIKRHLLTFAPAAAGVLLIGCFHDRVRFILMTLFRPISMNTEPWAVNWLGNRFLMMLYGWQGDYSLLEPHSLFRLPDSAPLLWLSETLTPFAVLLMIGLQLLLLRLLRTIGRSTSCRPLSLSSVLTSAVLLQTIMGLGTELMLNTSSLLGAPFLRSPALCLLLPLAVTADVYHPTLPELVSDRLEEKLHALMTRTGVIKPVSFPDFSPESIEFPPRNGTMTLEGVFPADVPIYYGTVPLRWVSRECSADGTPLTVRIPTPKVTVYESFPIKAAGKTYYHLNQLTGGGGQEDHCYRRYDMYGREVLYIAHDFPAFDEFDAMYDNRQYRWYYLRENEMLTCVYCADESDEIIVTEDVGEMDAERWGFFERTHYFP